MTNAEKICTVFDHGWTPPAMLEARTLRTLEQLYRRHPHLRDFLEPFLTSTEEDPITRVYVEAKDYHEDGVGRRVNGNSKRSSVAYLLLDHRDTYAITTLTVAEAIRLASSTPQAVLAIEKTTTRSGIQVSIMLFPIPRAVFRRRAA